MNATAARIADLLGYDPDAPVRPTVDEALDGARPGQVIAARDGLAMVAVAVLDDGTRIAIPAAPQTKALTPVEEPALPPALETGPTRRVPLGTIVGARSGDKGGDANVGLWVRSDEQWRWLAHFLTVERVRALLPETASLKITRHLLPNLRAVNFVVEGLLGQGVAYQARFDPQAKGLGEWLRARHVDIPERLLP